MKQLIFLIFFVSGVILWADNDQTDPGELVEIITTDDVEYLGVIIAENDTTVTLKVPSGIIIQIPTQQLYWY
ncbi:MAG: hypothetical protein HQ562_04805 [Candidatus Marinimicrobia bacterium]|nr:hypothetical protein [Candidatus Neomarinimicrobiota bacterium]